MGYNINEFNDKYSEYMRYLYAYGNKYFSNIVYHPNTDIDGLCHIALSKAITVFDESKECKFITLASNIFRNELLMQHRKNARLPNMLSIDYVYNDNSSSNKGTSLEEILIEKDFTQLNDEEDYIEYFMDLINNMRLNDREKYLLKASLDGKNQIEVANELGVSQSYISRLYTKLYRRINKVCNGGVRRD